MNNQYIKFESELPITINLLEDKLIEQTMNYSEQKVLVAAKLLGVSTKTLYRKLRDIQLRKGSLK